MTVVLDFAEHRIKRTEAARRRELEKAARLRSQPVQPNLKASHPAAGTATRRPALAAVVDKSACASVTSISCAPSFTGEMYQPDWFDFTIVCHNASAAKRFLVRLAESGMYPMRHNAAVTFRFDRNDTRATNALVNQLAFVALSEGFADPEETVEAVLRSAL